MVNKKMVDTAEDVIFDNLPYDTYLSYAQCRDIGQAVIAAIHPTVTDADLRMDSDGCWGYEPANGTLIESADGSAWFWDDDEGWRPLPTNSSCSLRGPATVLQMGGAA